MAEWNALPLWRRRAPRTLAAAVIVSLALPLAAQVQERIDHEAVYQFKEEGFQRSKVMEIASYLTDVHSPRLSGSPTYKKGAEWAVQQFTTWGLTNVKMEPFEFGRGWTNDRFAAHVVEPQAYSVIGYAKAWTPGTEGAVRAPVVRGVVENEADREKLKGTLRGKLVLSQPMREVKPSFAPLATALSRS